MLVLRRPDGTWPVKQRWDYKLYYGNSLFDSDIYKTKYKISWAYKDYYDNPKRVRDYHEWGFAFSWPKLLECGIVPSYKMLYGYPSQSKAVNRKNVGYFHQIGLSYGLKLPKI